MVREAPRLSTFVRTFANVCHPDEKYIDNDDDNIIEKKKEAEIVKRRLLAKRKAEEENEERETGNNPRLFGHNIPFHVEFKEYEIPPDMVNNLKCRPNPAAKFHLKNEINFQYEANVLKRY